MEQQATTNQQFAELLGWLTKECDVSFDPVVAKRAVQEAQQGWPGSEHDRWWKWLIEAGKNVGLRVRVIELTVEQALQGVHEKTLAVHLPDSSQPWLIIHRQSRQKFHVITAATGSSGRWVTRSQLASLMGNPSQDELMLWVAVEPVITCQTPELGPVSKPRRPMKPMARLWALLALERQDIRIVLVYATFVGVLALATPLAIEMLTNTVAFGRSLQPIIVLSLILFAFLAFSAILQAVEWYVVELIQRRLFVRVAGDLAYRLPRIQSDAFDEQYAPELMNRFFDIVTVQKVVATLLLDALALVMVAVTGMIVLALFHPLLLGVDLILMSLILLVLFGLGRGGTSSSIKESKVKYLMAAWLEGLARCRNTLKHGGGSEFAVEHADNIARKYLIARQNHFTILFRQVVFNLGLFAVGTSVFLAVGGYLVIEGQLSLGQLVAAELIVAIILGSVAKMGKHLEGFYDLMASVDKVGALFDLPLERQDGLLSLPGNSLPDRYSSEGNTENRGVGLKLRDVGYSYRNGPAVLEKINLAVESGASLGICGPMSCGKTTLAELLFGLRRATSGNIEIDGVNGNDLRPDIFRRHVSMVGPIEVIEGTIAENVHLDRIEVGSNRVHESLRQVGLLEEVFLLPQGLETPLTADGSPLSETQLRRLALARAIAGRPRLLVIDTLLDALPDNEAQQLMDFLVEKETPWTLIIFSGRHQILDRCDRIFSMDTNLSSSTDRKTGANQ